MPTIRAIRFASAFLPRTRLKVRSRCWSARFALATTSSSCRRSIVHSSAAHFPSIPASVPFDASAVAHAHRVGVNAFELDAIAQVISRLARDDNTVVQASMQADLTELQELGYVELSPTTSGTVSVNLLCPGALLSSYFWSVWVPRHLLDQIGRA